MIESRKRFISHLRKEKNYSEYTCNAYQRDINDFLDFILHQFHIKDPSEAETEHLRDWQMNLKEKNLKASSIARKLSSVRAFFSYLQQRGIVNANPGAQLKAPKKEQALPQTISANRLMGVLRHLSAFDEFPEKRDYTCLLLLYACGLRRSELVSLKMKDIESNTSYLRIKGKGGKERLLPLENKVKKELKEYIKLRNETFCRAGSEYLFLTDKGQPIYAKYIYRLVGRYLNDHNKGKVNPHLIRHSFATHLLENGAKIEYVRKLLGHSSLAATQVYTHMNLKKMQEVYADTHPRKNLLTKNKKK